MEVDPETYAVFANLFSIGKGKKGVLAWGDFVKAMTRLGFKYTPLGGSKRQFEPEPEPPRCILIWDEPHGKKKGKRGTIARGGKSALANKLGELYGWDADTFISK